MKIIATSPSPHSNFGLLRTQTLVLIVAILACGYSWSGEPDKSKSYTEKQHTNGPQRGTEKSPIFIKGEITTQKSKEESDRDAEVHKVNAKVETLKAGSDAGILKYTLYLAIFTFLLFITAAVQVIMFWQQLGLMRKTVKDGTIAANAAKASADATVTALKDIERPWLFVEAVRVVRREGAPIQPSIANNWYVSLKWKNVGRTPAIIKNCFFKIEDRDVVPDVPNHAGYSSLTCPSTISAGDSFETNKVGPDDNIRMKKGKDGNEDVAVRFIVHGELIYKDLSGKEHRTGYAVEVSANLPTFSTYENEAYEYYD